jgi:hypothetical protein
MEIRMYRLQELATINADQRRVELAKLLAAGLIRSMIERYRNPPPEAAKSKESLTSGLEDS